ncbi:MAG: hypothetical protein R3E31_22940 [Chloroflexota bacterium]
MRRRLKIVEAMALVLHTSLAMRGIAMAVKHGRPGDVQEENGRVLSWLLRGQGVQISGPGERFVGHDLGQRRATAPSKDVRLVKSKLSPVVKMVNG